jgi:hypothetical protein
MATATTTSTIVGVFEDRRKAQQAIADLKQMGYTESQIGVVTQGQEDGVEDATDTKAEEGAVTGLATGAGLGALWGIGILSNVLPGIGPALFGGTLGVILSSAAAGATAAGIGGALAGMGIPDDDAKYYEGEFKAGRTIVTVDGGPKAAQAQGVLTQYGAYNRSSVRR